MPKAVGQVISNWENAARAANARWRSGKADETPSTPLSVRVLEVMDRHRDVIAQLRSHQFVGSIVPAVVGTARQVLRARPGMERLDDTWTLTDDEQIDELLAILTDALDERLGRRASTAEQRGQVRATLRAAGQQLKQSLENFPDAGPIVEGQVARMIERVASRIDRTPRSAAEIELIERELSQTLGFVSCFEVLTTTDDGRDRIGRWRQLAAADDRATAAWAAILGLPAVPPSGMDDPELDTRSRGPHIDRHALRQAESVLTPHGGRGQSPLPDRLETLFATAGSATVTELVVREELTRERFPFALADAELRRGAVLAWLLLDARQEPDDLADRLAAVAAAKGQITSGRLAREVLRTTCRSFEPVGGVGVWDRVVIGALIQRDATLDLAADGWNDTLAEAIFADGRGFSELRSQLGPADVSDGDHPMRGGKRSEWVRPAGMRVRRRILQTEREGPFPLPNEKWNDLSDLFDASADEVFDWWVGNLRGRERQVDIGASVPEERRPESGRWTGAEVNRWMSGDVLANRCSRAKGRMNQEQAVEDIPDRPDMSDAMPAAGGVALRALGEEDFARIHRHFVEPVAIWIGRFVRDGVVDESVRWGDVADVGMWKDLSPETREPMDLVARWQEVRPNPFDLPRELPTRRVRRGSPPRDTTPARTPPGGPDNPRAVPKLTEAAAQMALHDLLEVLPRRAAQEFMVMNTPKAARSNVPAVPRTLRRSAQEYYRTLDLGLSARSDQRRSAAAQRLLDLMWIHLDIDPDLL